MSEGRIEFKFNLLQVIVVVCKIFAVIFNLESLALLGYMLALVDFISVEVVHERRFGSMTNKSETKSLR